MSARLTPLVPVPESRQDLLTGNMKNVGADIIGLGMHGSWTALALARLGLGRLRLWDYDVVSPENLETQAYRAEDIGETKVRAMQSILSAWCPTPRRPTVVPMVAPFSRQAAERHPLQQVVACCADDMGTRKAVAAAAAASGSRLFMESRSAGNILYVFAFCPTDMAVGYYLANHFPEQVADVPCGATGTINMGLQVASLMGSLVTLTKGGEDVAAIPDGHEVYLGLLHKTEFSPASSIGGNSDTR